MALNNASDDAFSHYFITRGVIMTLQRSWIAEASRPKSCKSILKKLQFKLLFSASLSIKGPMGILSEARKNSGSYCAQTMSATVLDAAMTAVLSVPTGSLCCYQLAQAAVKKFDWPAVKRTDGEFVQPRSTTTFFFFNFKGFPFSNV